MATPVQEEGATALKNIKETAEIKESQGEEEALIKQTADLLAELRKKNYIPANNAESKVTITMSSSLENLKVSVMV